MYQVWKLPCPVSFDENGDPCYPHPVAEKIVLIGTAEELDEEVLDIIRNDLGDVVADGIDDFGDMGIFTDEQFDYEVWARIPGQNTGFYYGIREDV